MRYLRDVVTLEYDAAKCNGCRLCATVCPHGVLGFENKRAVVTDRDACMECGACAMNCETGALTVESGVGCAAGVIQGALRGTGPVCDCGGGDCC